MKKKIVVLDGYASHEGDMDWTEFARRCGECEVYGRTPHELVVERCAGAELALTNKVPITASDMAQLPSLRYIGVLATGYNVVDVAEAHRRGIVVTNVPAYSTASMAQFTIAHLLNICSCVGHYSEKVRNGIWRCTEGASYVTTPLIELAGKVMGIVGFGNIGSAVARIAQSMGMNVLAVTSKAQSSLPEGVKRAESLDAMLRVADVVSLHCPLTAENRGFIGEHELGLMKPTAILLNMSRGPLVDEHALIAALRDGTIMAAGMDVMEVEPPREDNPLLSEPRCHITPHIGWVTTEAINRLLEIATENAAAFLAGNPVNVV